MIRTTILTLISGPIAFLAQAAPDIPEIPTVATELTLPGVLMFAIWWLGKQNTQISKESAERESALKAEYKAELAQERQDAKVQIEELKTELRDVRNQLYDFRRSVMMDANIDLSGTTRRSLIKQEENSNG